MLKKEDFVGFSRHEYNPIIRPQSEKLLVELIKKHKPQSVLEIGTYIGYSAALMLQTDKNLQLVSIEKDEQNYLDAQQNLSCFRGRVKLINCDALEFLQGCNKQDCFDFIFLDGPKGQYIKFLPYLKQLLKVGGVLVCDDVLFYGLVQSEEKIAHKHRSIVNNLRKFLQTLVADTDFETKIYKFEDGLSVSIKNR